MPFRNRSDAGRRLAGRLQFLRGQDVVVLGLPRGGVPVAAEVARALGAPLDVILVRKLGVPAQPELGLGAIGEAGARVINPEVVRYAHVSEAEIAQVERKERAELQRRAQRFREDAPHEPLAGRIAIIVDDGIATGSTARAACQVARALGAATVVLAVPVAPPSADTAMRGDADEVICLEMPEQFMAIGEWYEDFAQTSDEEVVALLRAARAGPGAPAAGIGPAGAGGARAGAGLVPGALAEQADGRREEQVREPQADWPREPAAGPRTAGQGLPGSQTAGLGQRGSQTAGQGQRGSQTAGQGQPGSQTAGQGQPGPQTAGQGERGSQTDGQGQPGHAADGRGEEAHAADGRGEAAHAADGTGPAAGGELAGLLAMMPFAAGLGIVLDAAAAGEVRGRLAWAPERCTSGGILHGGVLMALADSLGGICAFLNLPPGALTATTSSATVFTRAVRSGHVTAVTRPLHVGQTVIVVQTDMTDDAGRRVAQVTQTQAVLAGPA